jgi:hypothetical protein
LAQIIKDTDGPGKPRPNCYKNGELWIRPIDPVFALEQVGTQGLTPVDLYLLPIFVWLPFCVPGHPTLILRLKILLTTPLPTLDVSPSIELTSRAPEQTVFRFQGRSNPSLTVENPSKKLRLDNLEGSGKKRQGRRCARCAAAGCPRATDCKGKVGRNRFSCTSNEHEIGDKRSYG